MKLQLVGTYPLGHASHSLTPLRDSAIEAHAALRDQLLVL